jgi:hypothetical protein
MRWAAEVTPYWPYLLIVNSPYKRIKVYSPVSRGFM